MFGTVLSWGAIGETLMEEDYLQQDDTADPADAHLVRISQ